MIDYGSPQPLWEGSRKPSARLTLQKTFIAKGDITKSAAESIILSFSYPELRYIQGDGYAGTMLQSTIGSKTVQSMQDLDSNKYEAFLPPTALTGDAKYAIDFLSYVSQQYYNHTELDGISLQIGVDFLSDEDIKLGSGNMLNAVFFLKNFYSPSYNAPTIVNQTYDRSEQSFKLAQEFIARNAFLINKDVFIELKSIFREEGDGANNILHIIGFLTDLSSGSPVLKKNLTQNEQDNIAAILHNMEVEDPAKALDQIKKYFDRLYDFPVSAESIELLQIGGTFSITGAEDILLTIADFDKYDLSLEYNALNADDQSEMVYLHYDWSTFRGKVTNNTIHFSFSASNLIIPADGNEVFMVYLRGTDGMELWSKEYKAGSAALRNIHVVVPHPDGNMAKPGDATVVSPKRLRGQILDMTGQKPVLTGAMVVIEAKAAGDADFHIVGSALSDKDGYFSLPYPKGIYIEARAVLSLMPDSPVAIPVRADKGDGRTISDDFIYLLLKAVTAPSGDAHAEDDCDCHNTLKATRLPDHDDLIHADEYTQDLGAGCINLSTPNRTLREYNHCAVVRTSDPDVANYTLVKDASGKYTLTGEKKKIRRKSIDLNNPIRWQDTPDASGSVVVQPGDPADNSHSNLSFYQAVSLATGHILHYKSMFKADGYSLGELIYSLPLAPGQKKQIVVFDSQHNLQGSESQQLSVSERLAANIVNDRDVVDQLSGSISEALRGRSSAETGGVGAAAGVAGSAGAVGGAVGIAGGYAMAGSNASQDSARDISQFFAEKLRNSVMQNADSYRQQNASVVSTVREGQTYSASTEVVANHNHCHSLTMMYFEVLRHYAIYQELTSVEECVFVPLLLTNFTQENIYKWRDVLGANLLPLPSNTYLPAINGQHPLARAFDANERMRVNWTNVDFPENRYCDEPIGAVKGWMQLRVNLPRPRTRYDRILSFPLIERKEGGVSGWDMFRNFIIAPFTGGIPVFGSPERNVQGRAKIFDAFMTLEANWESVPPSRCIRIKDFGSTFQRPEGFEDVFKLLTYQAFNTDFFDGNETDRLAWEAYAKILGKANALALLNDYFKNQIIGDWDKIFHENVATPLYEKLIDSKLTLAGLTKTEFTSIGRYYGGEAVMWINLNGTTSLTRAQLPAKLELKSTAEVNLRDLVGTGTLRIENIHLTYTTAHFANLLYTGYVGQDLDTGAEMEIPLTEADRRNPKTEDRFVVSRLIDHLNSNLEHYNKVLWYNLDADRRYMLLDGFNVQVYNDFGVPVGLKSIASVIKNELITIAGNSLVFPVSPGFKVGRSYLVEKTTTGGTERVTLLDHYKPLTPPAPYRISVPTKGLFMEAVQGQCNACEKVQPNTSQDWAVFKADEPTSINSITAPTPTITDWKATFKDIAAATVSMQTAPAAPAVGAGLEGLSTALTKSDTFRDVAGLAGNQQNAASTYKANMEAATKMAEIAKGLATQEHNTDKSAQIMDKLKEAKESGAITAEDYNKLVKQHLQQQIDGGDAAKAQAKADAQKAASATAKPTITDAAVNAINKGNASVKATKTDGEGNVESVEIGTPDTGSKGSTGTENILAQVVGKVPLMKQDGPDACWATAATMMMSWRISKNGEPLAIKDVLRVAGPGYVDIYVGTETQKPRGLLASEKPEFLKGLSMVAAPKMSAPPSWYVEKMNDHGAIWATLDSATANGKFSPHACILTKITGTGTPDGKGTFFHFNDPADNSKEMKMSFAEFINGYEQVVTDNKSKILFDQIVYFEEKHSWLHKLETAEGSTSDDGAEVGEGHSVWGPWNAKYPVHENMTLSALMQSDLKVPTTVKVPTFTDSGDQAVNEYLRGVIWNDDPECLLFDDDFILNSNNMNYSSGANWGLSFEAGNYIWSKAPTNLVGRSHFGDMQFLHSQATMLNEDPKDTRAMVLLWAEFMYRVALSAYSDGPGAIAGSTKLKDVPVTSKFKDKTYSVATFFTSVFSTPRVSDTVDFLLMRGTHYKKPMVARRALGSLMHLIQDSFAKGHTKRRLINPEHLVPGTSDKFIDGKYGQYGEIEVFHTYKGQNEGAHSYYDRMGQEKMYAPNPESFNGIIGARDAIRFCTAIANFWAAKKAYDDGPRQLIENEIYKLSDKARPADAEV